MQKYFFLFLVCYSLIQTVSSQEKHDSLILKEGKRYRFNGKTIGEHHVLYLLSKEKCRPAVLMEVKSATRFNKTGAGIGFTGIPVLALGTLNFLLSILTPTPAAASYAFLGIVGTGVLIEYVGYKLKKMGHRHGQKAIDIYNQSVLSLETE
jgi:hypothetical protein